MNYNSNNRNRLSLMKIETIRSWSVSRGAVADILKAYCAIRPAERRRALLNLAEQLAVATVAEAERHRL